MPYKMLINHKKSECAYNKKHFHGIDELIKRNIWLYTLPIILIFVITISIITGILPIQQLNPINDSKEEYNIKISGLAWDFIDDPVINILIIPNPNLSGWKDSNIDDVKEAFNDWIYCIQLFTHEYGYHYLENIKFEIDVSKENTVIKDNYDIIVNWINQIDSKGAAGAAVMLSNSDNRITKATITLPISVIKDGKHYILSDIDVTNIATDEIGHSLGLGHSNFKGDVLYGFYDFPQEEYCHSTLDIYGLAIIYQYLNNNLFESPSKSIVQLEEIGITYHHLKEHT